MKCLIADDDFVSRVMHKEMLSSQFDCDIATNGEEAVNLFRMATDSEQPYDLICLDVMMPVCDGHEALCKIRTIEKDSGVSSNKLVKVIMVSALSDPKTVIESYCKGGTSYIVKPVTKNKLTQILKTFRLMT